MKVLIVEDEKPIADLIQMHLEHHGYDCDYAPDGNIGANKIEEEKYDLVLLDIMLPHVDGYELMEYIEPLKIPVIFITAKGSVKDKVKGLQMGADDYLVKPFSVDELLARVESVLRRYHRDISTFYINDIIIDTNARQVKQDGKVLNLTNKEYDLLLFLVRNKNIVLYRDTLYEKVWDTTDLGHTRTLDLHIQRLRKKLKWKDHIKTVFGIGYILEVDDEICS